MAPDGPGPAAPAAGRWDGLLGQERRTRARVQQSAISFLTYLTGGLVAAWGTSVGVVSLELFIPWAIMVTVSSIAFFALARSRAGLRIHDATFTEAQILWGVFAIDWAYAMCGAWRSSALLPLVMAINFGTLTLNGGRLMRVTAIAILSLAATIAVMHGLGWHRLEDLWLDLSNLAFVSAITPCAALLSARFGAVRQQLKAQHLQLEQALARIEEIATRDPLTGIPNRRYTLDVLAVETDRLARGGKPFTVALIDLDHFKRVNDTHGHGRGDAVLRRFAELSGAEIRKTDVIARWGGEEFLLVSPDTDTVGARALLDRIRGSLKVTVHDDLPAGFRLTVSIGLACAVPGESIERLLERADQSLYRAKRLGRDRIEEAGDAIAGEAVARDAAEPFPLAQTR